MKHSDGFQVNILNNLIIGKILDQIEDKFKFEVRVNNQTEVRYALKSNEYQEVHPSCLGIKLNLL